MAGIASSSSSSSEDLSLQNTEGGGLDQLLQNRRKELLSELKLISQGERPVTGRQSREQVSNFFTRRLLRPDNTAHVANIDDVEEHRPQQIVIEVQGLLQRRSVSSALQSYQFRRSLESVIRQHVTNSPTIPRAQRRQATTSVQPPVPTSTHIPVPPPIPTHLATEPEADLNSLSSSDNLSSVSQQATVPPPQPAYYEQMIHPTARAPAEPWRGFDHEHLVMEISELVHRQLVTSTLEGDFRENLERHVRRRLDDSGTDGIAVMRHINSLPPSNITRNDFSNFGLIPPAQQIDLDDAVSVISATASATIPFAQSNAAVNRELGTLKAQIAQLTNMLKASLDLQVDIQRSIKQEVAAAVHQATQGQGASTPQTFPTARSHRASESKCIVCVETDADTVLYRCGHISMCYGCSLRMKENNGLCPVCRAPILDIVRAYRISYD